MGAGAVVSDALDDPELLAEFDDVEAPFTPLDDLPAVVDLLLLAVAAA